MFGLSIAYKILKNVIYPFYCFCVFLSTIGIKNKKIRTLKFERYSTWYSKNFKYVFFSLITLLIVLALLK